MKKIIFEDLINKNRLLPLIFSCAIQLGFICNITAQTISISGNVSTSTTPVKNALVTFEDNSFDVGKKYTVLTDASGNYGINVLITSVEAQNNIPTKFDLEQNYPNPFSSKTTIQYSLKQNSDVQVTIYDILGRIVRKYSAGIQSTGSHKLLWDGCNNFGSKVATGTYFYKLQAGGESLVKKMIYNSGMKGSVYLSPTYSSNSGSSKTTSSINKSMQGVYFNISIANTDSTSPAIVAQQFNNVLVQNDSTISFSVTSQAEANAAKIYPDSLLQYIRGFGAANIIGWRADMTSSEIETAFGTGDGQLGFSILRLRVAPDSNQWSVNVSSAKKAYDKGVLIFASPWTPPASMKTNNNTVGGELKESSYADYAKYLNNFSKYMTRNGVPLYAVSLQNEPDITVTYESCDWNSSQFVKFLSENGSAIETKIIAPESYHFDHNLSDPILNDPAACENLDIVGGHIYGGGLASYSLAKEKGKEVWMTEHLTESLHSANVWSLALDVGLELHKVMQANMNAYVWWYIVRYYGPIGDGEKSTSYPNENFSAKGEITKKGYVMSQFSRFIRPGFHRIKCSTSSKRNVYLTSYKNDSGKIVIVAVNTNSSAVEQAFTVTGEDMATFTPYTTSSSKNCEKGSNITAVNGTFTTTLEPSSVMTFVSN